MQISEQNSTIKVRHKTSILIAKNKFSIRATIYADFEFPKKTFFRKNQFFENSTKLNLFCERECLINCFREILKQF